MAKLTTTGSSTTESSLSTNGLTARERSRIATAQAVAAATQAQAEAEKAARVAPVTGTVTGYDDTTGDWLVETPDGGTVRTQSLTNASLAGQRLPIQRFADSQTSTVNAPPTEADASWVVGELEALQRDVVALGAVQVQDRDPDGAADARYPGDKWLNNVTNALFIFDFLAEDWVPTGGADVLVLDVAPTDPPTNPKTTAFVREPKEAYTWDAEFSAWLGPYGGGGGMKHILSSQTTDNEVDPAILNPGDLFTNEGSKRLYYYTGTDWVLYPWKSCEEEFPCGDPDPPPHDPGLVCTFGYVGTQTGFLPGPDFPCAPEDEGGFNCTDSGWAWSCREP